MFAPGIPGRGIPAVLMSGTLLQGIAPGAKPFHDGAADLHSIFTGFPPANSCPPIVGLLAARFLAKLALVPGNILCSSIFCFAVVGSFALRRSMIDVTIHVDF